MSEDNWRFKRIEKLLQELTYELKRGFMEGEIDETIGYRHIVPISRQIPDGIVIIDFNTRPVHRHSIYGSEIPNEPRLKVIK